MRINQQSTPIQIQPTPTQPPITHAQQQPQLSPFYFNQFRSSPTFSPQLSSVQAEEPNQSLEVDSSPVHSNPSFNFNDEFHKIARPESRPQPLYEQPLRQVQHYRPAAQPQYVNAPQRQTFGNIFQQERQSVKTTVAPTQEPDARNPKFGRYHTQLVYDPATGQYTSIVVQAMPNSKKEFELTQKLQAFVGPQKENLEVFRQHSPQIRYFGAAQAPTQSTPAQNNSPRPTPFFNAANLYQTEPTGQPQPEFRTVSNLQFIPPHLRPGGNEKVEIERGAVRELPNPTAGSPASGQIDAFLRSLNIAL